MTYISQNSLSLCTTYTTTECPARLIVSLLLLILCVPIKPEVLPRPLANTSVIQSAPNMEKNEAGSKA